MNLLQSLIEAFLVEAAALTKGSQRVMNDKKLVAGLADSVRDDSRTNPASFPPGSARTFQKTSDEAIAQWFLENIDNIERAGYDGVVYSRDGVNSDWIVRRYIAGSHNWEDLTGVMNMNLLDWYLLKNRNMLDPNHKDLPKFNSVRDVGFYMTTHYKDKLAKLRDAAKNATRNKMAKSIKLVDNEDYRIYTTLNRAAGCALGLGTQWCTANSATGAHFHRYTNAAMLFQLFPYVKKDKEDNEGDRTLDENEKYQFDAGSGSFMNITDNRANPKIIKQKFPYIYTDLARALKTNKPKMEQAFAELSQDPTLQSEDFKIKTYEIDEEIEKLHKFVDQGFFTEEKRPAAKSAEPEKATQPEQGQIAMKPDEITEDTTIGHIVRQFKPVGQPDQDGQESPLTHGDEIEGDDVEESEFPPTPDYKIGDSVYVKNYQGTGKIAYIKNRNDVGVIIKEPSHQRVQTTIDDLRPAKGIEEDDVVPMQDPNQAAQAQTGGTLGSAGLGAAGGGQYPPGTAPTMPESINHQGKITMENVDKDVAAMLQSLKKYDTLKESVAPVMGMVTLGEKKKDGKKPEWLYKEEEKTEGKKVEEKKSGLKSKNVEEKKEKVEEGADQEVLAWMSRFSKLGNMKGYGR